MLSDWVGFVILLIISVFLSIWNYQGAIRQADQTQSDKSEFKLRHATNWLSFVLLAALFVLLHFDTLATYGQISLSATGLYILGVLRWALCVLSLIYTGSAIGLVLYASMSQRNKGADARQLATDTFISILLNLFAAAVLYKELGFQGTAVKNGAYSDWTYLYFSAVTFSTLGYGDFSPAPAARGFAALQAILGNLHLGIIAGTVLFALREPDKPV